MQKPPIYGNYARYYGMRSAAAAERARRARGMPGALDKVPEGGMDERVAALVAWLGDRSVGRVLDIGCNAAKPLIELCEAVAPQEAVGVDIDASLIGSARAAVRSAWSQVAPENTVCADSCRTRYFPTSFSALFGTLPLPPESDAFPSNITLVAGDWVTANDRASAAHATISPLDERGYDVVLWYAAANAACHSQSGSISSTVTPASCACWRVLRPCCVRAGSSHSSRNHGGHTSRCARFRASYAHRTRGCVSIPTIWNGGSLHSASSRRAWSAPEQDTVRTC